LKSGARSKELSPEKFYGCHPLGGRTGAPVSERTVGPRRLGKRRHRQCCAIEAKLHASILLRAGRAGRRNKHVDLFMAPIPWWVLLSSRSWNDATSAPSLSGDWRRVADSKTAYWLDQKRVRSAAQILAAGDALRRHALTMRPGRA